MYEPYEELDSDEEEVLDQRSAEFQAAVRQKEEDLIATALERIARARVKGKTNVSLTPAEMEALERRGTQQPEPSTTPTSPPTPPGKKSKATMRSSSTSSLASQRSRKRASTGLFGTPPAKSNSKAKVTRKAQAESAHGTPPQPPVMSGPTGIMVPGPDGVPVYAPIAYYQQTSPELRARVPVDRRARSSSWKHHQRESSPSDQGYGQVAPVPRHYPAATGVRPPSASSNRSLPDDIDWQPPPPRSISGPQSAPAYRPPLDDYDEGAAGLPPSLPAAQGWRVGPGQVPAEVRYSSLRRVPAASSPLANRHSAAAAASVSDPVVHSRMGELARDRPGTGGSSSSSSSSSSDDQGVQVDVVATSAGGYVVRNAPPVAAAAAESGGGRTRRRKEVRR